MKRKPIALITGITGQDGSYLAELLLEKKYEVHGIIRRSSSFNTGRIDHIFDKLHLHYGDVTDGTSLTTVMRKSAPDEIYHLAAQSHVKVSFELPEYTAIADGIGTLKLMEAVMTTNPAYEDIRIYNACTSEMYGSSPPPQYEPTPFKPCSPYGSAKLYSYWIARNYRESYGMHISNGILFNHESPRRGATFVTRKVVRAAVRIKNGFDEVLKLGNLDAIRDWGHAKDYVEAMWLMMQQEKPDDYVIATGRGISVKELVYYTFHKVGLDIEWVLDNEKNTLKIGLIDGKPRILAGDEHYNRPNEVPELVGHPAKAKRVLGWQPKYTFEEMIDEMIEHEERDVQNQLPTS